MSRQRQTDQGSSGAVYIWAAVLLGGPLIYGLCFLAEMLMTH